MCFVIFLICNVYFSSISWFATCFFSFCLVLPLVSMAITTSNKEFILDSYDTDGGESSMAHNPHELTPPLPKEGIL